MEAGIDLNGNGALDDDEVQTSTVVCNGVSRLVAVSDEMPGDHCVEGGQKIESGFDLDNNGVLSAEEIEADATTYVCNGLSMDSEDLAREIWSAQYRTPGMIDMISNANVAAAPSGSGALVLTQVGRTPYDPDRFDESAAESIAFSPSTDQIFVTNAQAANLNVLTVAADGGVSLASTVDVRADVAAATGITPSRINSVAYNHDTIAVAVAVAETITVPDPEAAGETVDIAVQQPGFVVFYDVSTPTPAFIAAAQVGVLPDMVTFTADGAKVLSADEGEPPFDYSSDPEGTVSIINRPAGGWAAVTDADVTTLGFTDFNVGGAREAEFPADGRHVGPPTSTRSQTLEPESVEVSPDGLTAMVVLQEQNAVAVINLVTDSIAAIRSLGVKDGMDIGNAFDASDRDDAVHIVNWPVFMMYQPDVVASFSVGGASYYVTANEGDVRDDGWWGWFENERLGKLNLDQRAFPDAAVWQDNALLGRLTVTTTAGDLDGDGDFDEVYAFGGRSFSIWDETGALVFDSGNDFETITASLYGHAFNNDNAKDDPDGRSDAKGPEPECVDVGTIGDRIYAFIGLERIGGIMVYDVTDPEAPEFVLYENNRDLTRDPADLEDVGDLGPESLVFVSPADSPTGAALLIEGNEVSGTVTIYEVVEAP